MSSRRDLLKGSLVGAAGLVVAGCTDPTKDPYRLLKQDVPGGTTRGEEKFVATSCAQCPLGCGMTVRVYEGRGVKVEGNRDHPVNHGGLGMRGHSSLEVLYAPNRIHAPMRRKGGRGSKEWETISWDAAIAGVAGELTKIRASGPQKLTVISGRERGMMRDLWKRFCAGYGTPNFIEHSRRGPSGTLARAAYETMGLEEYPAVDIAHAATVLSLGSALLEGGCYGTYATLARARGRRDQAPRRTRFVHVDSALSHTAAYADESITARPGTLDTFAYAVASELLKEGRYDKAYVEEKTFGFHAWTDATGVHHPGFEEAVATCTPEHAAQITGVPADVIRRVAQDLAKAPPALVIVDDRSVSTSNGLSVARAALALNALLGGIETAGGLRVQRQPPLADWPEFAPDEIAKVGLASPRVDSEALKRHPMALSCLDSLPKAIAAGQPYAPAAAFLYYTNPTGSAARPSDFRAALEKVPLVVSFSPYEDESTAAADYVLPDHTFLERLEDTAIGPWAGPAVFGLTQPVVKPLHDTRHAGDVLLGLAAAMGGPVAAALPWKTFKDAMQVRLAGLRAANRGSIVADDDEAFFKKLSKAGFWADDAALTAEPMKTPSGKFSFFSEAVLDAYRLPTTAPEALAESGAPSLDARCLGQAVDAEWSGDEKTYPFYFLPYYRLTHATGGPPLPNLSEVGDPLTGARWTIPAELNPVTAAREGIGEGDEVMVFSPAGQIRVRARLFEGVPEDAVRMPMSRTGDSVPFEANARELLAPARSATGETPLWGVRVRLERA